MSATITLSQALAELRKLSENPVSREFTLPRVENLLGLFIAANTTENPYASEKIEQVRIGFKKLANQRQKYDAAKQARSNLGNAVAKLGMIIEADGNALKPGWGADTKRPFL